ncbi:MAG: hypothetical protein HKL80_10505, partial [Acidimicrobiales bacterium]|nr:hypothetical protein [Acidimicrobiales bacterium]
MESAVDIQDPAAPAVEIGAGPNDGRILSYLGLAAVCAYGLWKLLPELTAVTYLDDSSMHEQMVRFAQARFSQGHLPLTSWFPYLGEGSPHMLHYQSLPAMIVGAIGLIIDPNFAFRLSLYLLLSLWPISIYISSRLFGFGRLAATCSAVLAPFIVSVPGVGYEQNAYVWIGFGLWAQLFASWTLPLAWGYSFKAVGNPRYVFPSVIFISLTVCFHFETGYLALIGAAVFSLFGSSRWKLRISRSIVVLALSFGASMWAIVPLIADGKWAGINQILNGTYFENGYGARQTMAWLISGAAFDYKRFPVISIAFAVGLIVCLRKWPKLPRCQALVTMFAISLIISFGRTTFHSLANIFPGGTDIFYRRFFLGCDLSGLIIAGVGVEWLAKTIIGEIQSYSPGTNGWFSKTKAGKLVRVILAVGIGVIVTTPLLIQMGNYDNANAANIATQSQSESIEGKQIAPLLAYIKTHSGGRVYAGMPSNWGTEFRVGYVPVFKYIEAFDIPEVGYTLRTASLMSNPEYYFDDQNLGDYSLFGIKYLLYPS